MSLYVLIKGIKSIAMAILCHFINYRPASGLPWLAFHEKKNQHEKPELRSEERKMNSLFVIKYEKLTESESHAK